jgi:hypothetical protein
MAERLDEESLKALIAGEIRSAQAYDASEMQAQRIRALEYSRGVMRDLPSLPGRSKVVSRDFADTVSWIVPGIMRVFTASDKMGEFEPVKPNDEAGAKQATDYINHLFWKDNPGYRTLWNATQDALNLGNGIVKHFWDDTEECEYSEMSGQTAEQIQLLQDEEGVEITAGKQGEPQRVSQPDPQTGQMVEVEVPTWNIKLKRITSFGRLVVECIPREKFLIDADATTIEEARFTAHVDRYPRSHLIKMGFDADVVANLPAYHASMTDEENTARNNVSTIGLGQVGDDSTTLIDLAECYIKCDVDGDGESETVRAFYSGAGGTGELLDWEVWDDDCVFSDIPCEPVAHRFQAESIFDQTEDIQDIKTVVTRGLLDNIYATNVPGYEAEEGAIINPESVLAPKFGGITYRKKGAMPLVPKVVPFVGDKALLALEYVNQMLEKRTGVSRATMALDPDTLQNQTATANQNQRDAAYSKIELIARNMAELGWRRVFRQMLRLVAKHQDRVKTIRLRDEWVDIDPRVWNASMDVTINVGLGTGSRDRDMQMLNNTLQIQMGMLQKYQEVGLVEQALDMLQRIMKTSQKMAESAGLKNPDEYFPTISPEDMQKMMQTIQEKASQPDPKVQAELQIEQGRAQTQMQIEQAKIQATAQLKQVELQQQAQLKQVEYQVNTEKERAQMEADLMVKNAEMQKDERLQGQKAAFDAAEAEKEREFKLQLEMMKLNAQAQQADKQMANDRDGQREQMKHDGESKKREAKSKTNEALIKSGKAPMADGVEPEAMLAHMKELVEAFTKASSAPKRVVRDPKTGRAVGVETVTN